MARRNPPAIPPQRAPAAQLTPATLPRLGSAPSKRWRLEPRVLLDAAVPVTLDVTAALATTSADDASAAGDSNFASWAEIADLAQPEALAPRQELVVVDTSIDGWQALLADSLDTEQLSALAADRGGRFDAGERTLTVLLLDAEDDGIAAVERALGAGDGYDAVHLFSHASRGQLTLGSSTLDASGLAGDELAGWRGGLRGGADILLYGCNVADGEAGIAFVRSLAASIGADVAASIDPTGSAALGGDYELELSVGEVATPLLTGARAASQFDGLLVATAAASLDVPAEEFINESINFTVAFDNAGTTPGYAPFFDLVVPAGITGVTSGSAFASGDVTLTVVGTWDATLNGGAGGWRAAGGAPVTVHPYGAGLALPTGTAGATWSIADLPFGSFTQDQPAVITTFTGLLNKAQGALVGTPLAISARGGFRFGNDPLDNPTTDAPVQQAAAATDSVTPQVIRFEKTNDRPENEVATGPNEPITYTLRVNVATGESVSLTQLADQLPSNLQYLPGSLTFVTAPSNGTNNITLVEDTNGVLIAGEFDEPTGGAPQTGANALLRLNYGTVVGRAGDDIVVTYRAFVPEFDASGARVLPAATGTHAAVTNNASASVDYDPDGTGGLPAATITRNDTETLTAKPIAIQKGVAVLGGADALPGATLVYTLRVQMSDFFAMDQLVIDDHFTDGQSFDESFTPTYVLSNNGVTSAARPFAASNFTAPDPPNTDRDVDGDSDVQFRLSDQFVADGQPARLEGDLFSSDANQAGQSEVVITFRTRIDQNFVNVPTGMGDRSVDLGDVLTNTVTQTGRIIQDNLTPGSVVTDDSAASVTIESIEAAKSIFAINGSTSFTDVKVGPGDTVTYRIRLALPSADVENLVVGDFLPLPVFEVGQLDTTDGTTNNATNIIPFGGVPAAGRISFGPDHNLPQLFDANSVPINLPTLVQVDTANNRFTIDFGSFDDGGTPSAAAVVIDLLYTVSATDRPFADGLLLTNNAIVSLNNTVTELPDVSRIAQIQVSVPELRLTKGVVATDATTTNTNEANLGRAGVTFDEPGSADAAAFNANITSSGLASAPITTNLTGVDNGDFVTFAIVIENTGSNDAFDLIIRDTLPADGLRIPTTGLNLKVTTGNGTPLTFTGAANDLFAGGIRINDPEDAVVGSGGAIGPQNTASASTGSNIVVITYDLQVFDAVAAGDVVIPNALLANSATLSSFGGRNNGNDFTDGAEGPWQDNASASVAPPGVTKELVSSSVEDARNLRGEGTIGEVLTYRVTVRVPEGTQPSMLLIDTLDAGLEFITVTAATSSSGLAFATTFDVTTLNANTTLGGSVASGQNVSFSVGTITNGENDNGDAETITIEYTVRVADIAGNVAGAQRNNSVTVFEDLDGNPANALNVAGGPASAPNVLVIEPNLNVTKTIDAGTRDNGSTVTYRVTIENIAGAAGADAFGVTFSDVLPAGLSATGVTVNAVHNNGGTAPTVGFDMGTGTVSATAFDLQEGHSVSLVITATIEPDLLSRSTITNTGTIAWTSLPGTPTGERSYNDSSAVNFDVAAPSLAKSRLLTSLENPNNATGEAVVGELITYRLVVTVPEARLPTFAIRDVLDVGLEFVDVIAVTSTATLTSTTITDLNSLAQIQAATSVASIGIAPNDQNQLTIALGTLQNNQNSDLTAETITIDYRVRVLDVASNTPGTLRNNQADIRFDRNNDGDSDDSGEVVQFAAAPDTRIIQPNVTVNKTVSAPVADVGSRITYTIVLNNAGGTVNGTDAYDLAFSDVLPTQLDGSAANVSVDAMRSTGASAPTFSYTEGTRTIAAAPFDLAEGESLTITITARIAEGVAPNTTVNNVANLAYSTLPGTVAGERTLNASDDEPFTTRVPTIAKTLVDTSVDSTSNTETEATIGEILTYQVSLTAPESVLPGVVLFDMLDAGLEFIGITQVTTAAALTSNTVTLDLAGVQGATTVSGTVAGGQSLRITLGNVTNSDRNDAAAETIVVQYQVRVANIAAVNAGSALNNSAALLLDLDGNGDSTNSVSASQAANITVVEPTLVIDKSANDSTVFLGQQVTYTLAIRHPASAGANDTDAHDIRIADVLPSGLVLNVASIQATGATITSNTSAGNSINLTLNSLAVGANATVTYTATVVSNAAAIGTALSNTAQMTWSSQAGASPFERTGAGGVNDYAASDGGRLIVTAVDLAVSKSDGGITATPGGVVRYVLSYRNGGTEGATGVVLRETVPTGSTFNAAASTAGWVNVGGNAYELTIGNLARGTHGTATFAVTVTDPVAVGQASLANTVSIRDDGTHGPDRNTANNSGSDSTPINAAPDYTITKSSTPALPIEPGETIPYTLEVRNLGNENGTGVSFVDRFDPTLVQVNPASIVTPTGVTAVVDNVAGTITFTVTNDALVTAGSNFTVRYDATVRATLPAGADSIAGTATITGANETNLTNNSDPDVVPILAQPDYALSKSAAPLLPLEPGESVPYRLTLRNVGNQDGTTATIADRIDVNLASIVAGSVVTPAGVSAVIDAAAGTLTLTVTNADLLRAGASFDVDYVVRVRDVLPAGADELPNSATVTGAGDLDGGNNTATQVVPLTALPDYVITKSSSAAGATLPGAAITYSITVRNAGTQGGTNIVVTDVLPSGLLGNPQAISNGGTFDANNGAVTWRLPTLAAGASVTLTFQATVASQIPAGAESVLNSVSVTDDGRNGADPNPGNNSAATRDTVDAAPDYAVTKTRNATGPLLPGDAVAYTLVVRNLGNQAGSNVLLTDLYDPTVVAIDLAGLTLPAGVTASIDATTATISFMIADSVIEAGESVTIGVSGTVLAPVRLGAEAVINDAVVLGDGDTNLANNSARTSDPLEAAPDYTVAKSNNATFPVIPGNRIDFTLDVANIGNQGGSNAVIVDTFDPRVLAINPADIVVPPGVTVSVDNVAGTITFRINDDALVASGAAFRIVIPATVQGGVPVAAEDIASIARIDGDDDSNLTNNADPDNFPLVAAPDLAIEKTTAATNIAPGGTLTYTLTVRNVGDQGATGVTFVDTYDASLVQILSITPINGTPSSGVTIVDNGTGQIRFVVTDAALTEVNDRLDYAIVARVAASVPLGAETLRNSATVFAPDEGNFTNNATLLGTPLLASPDYSVVKTSSQTGALAPGDTATYSLRVRNVGNQDGSSVTVTDVFLPSAASVVAGSIVAPAGVVTVIDATAGTITFEIPDALMAANADLTLRYELRVNTTLDASAEALANIAVIRGDNDANPINDTSRVQANVNASPDVAVTITDGRTTVAPGEQPVYVVTIDNVGNQDASGVTARVNYDPTAVTIDLTRIALPPGVTVSEPTPGTLVFSVGDLGVAAPPLDIRIPTTVINAPSGATGVLLQASVAATEDGNPANDAASDLDTLNAAPDYSIAKTSSNTAPLVPGQTVTYTLTVRNVGNQNGTGVVVTDDLPVGLLRTGVVISDGGSLDANTGRITWNIGNLDAGATRTLTVTATVQSPLPVAIATVENRASVTDDGRNGDDPTPANNSVVDSDPVAAAPDLRVDISDGVEIAQRTDVITYRLDIANVGNQGATGTTLVFRFPPGSLVITATSVPAVIDPVAGTVTFNVGSFPVGAAQQLTITARVADTAVPDANGRIAVTATIADDGTNGTDPTPANNVDREDVTFVDDQRNVVYFTDNGRRLSDPGIPDGDRLRTYTYEQYPQWLHGRLISLETMQSDANLVGGRTEVKFDTDFGVWNHQFFPNPWNHDRADFTKNAEWLDDFVNWLGAQASDLGEDLDGATLEKQIDAAVRGDRGTLLRHLSKLSGSR